jgi:hypothetical protein
MSLLRPSTGLVLSLCLRGVGVVACLCHVSICTLVVWLFVCVFACECVCVCVLACVVACWLACVLACLLARLFWYVCAFA